MAKKKKPGIRRRNADELLLRRYARTMYHRARAQKAVEAGVPLHLLKNRTGHGEAIAAGYVAIRAWWNTLAESMKARARAKLLAELEPPTTTPEDTAKFDAELGEL